MVLNDCSPCVQHAKVVDTLKVESVDLQLDQDLQSTITIIHTITYYMYMYNHQCIICIVKVKAH